MSHKLAGKPEAELYETLHRDVTRPDYNLEDLLNDNRDCPFCYAQLRTHLNVCESATLLSFANKDFFAKHELSYSRYTSLTSIKNIQNSTWARQHYNTGLDLAKQKMFDQAIGIFR